MIIILARLNTYFNETINAFFSRIMIHQLTNSFHDDYRDYFKFGDLLNNVTILQYSKTKLKS